MDEIIIIELSKELDIKPIYIKRVLELLEDDNTIAFISRYRKDYTNGLDEIQIKEIYDRYKYNLKLNQRKEAIIKSLKEKDILTPELETSILNTKKLIELENLYKPYSTGKKTKANIAIAKGLKPFALFLLSLNKKVSLENEANKYIDSSKGVNNLDDVIEGSKDIIADIVNNDLETRNKWLDLIYAHSKITTKLKDKEKDVENKYQIYYNFSKPIKYLQSYQIMALNRAYDKKIISFSFEYKKDFLTKFIVNKYTKKVQWEGQKYIEDAVKNGLKRLLIPSVENQVYSELLSKAQEKSANIFTNNLTNLLLQKPIKNKTILGWDPAYKTGCKLAVVDSTNKVLEIDVIYPTKPRNNNDLIDAENKIINLLKKYNIDLIAIGNGTASWESIQFISKVIQDNKLNVNFIITSEAGASVYSASKVAIKEFPDLSVEQRSAINIARRNIDPLAELIKIDPKSIGVGQYQHDIPSKLLDEKLEYSVTSCVNKVGVDVNTASTNLLSYISGINLKIAKNIVSYIIKNEKIKNRNELLKISGISEKIFQQAAGFLRISDSDEFLDKTSIHPELYEKTYKIINHFNLELKNLDKIKDISIEKIVKELKLDYYETKLIVDNLSNPLRDYRDDLSDPILRNNIIEKEKLEIGMQFKGIIRNITEFGAFIEIGLKDDVFLHISNFNDKEININDVVNVEIFQIKPEGNITVNLIKE
ncbi:Tex-like N-terminal domain-containing protein [Mesomycoplasma molare]|uniref:Helix-hairpin-helix domain-containing protein n=1 Tax=Mesomycoplasma molare TaxID=171288 RepID=A0ABY5TUM7_9BACT|nr:Tex-like N-terminal domain-containing protein [Mesomycoplasma molare]UWD33955.1 helix-hairpin-helix domain-containing protein [Mesomycoplasma molare]